MLSKELIKEVMATKEYQNRPTHWVNRKTDRGLFISENEKVFVGSDTECRNFIENQVSEVDVYYHLYTNDVIIVTATGRRTNAVRNAYDFCRSDYDVLGSEIKEDLEVNQMVNSVKVEFYLYDSVNSDTFLSGLKRCNCCGKYHTAEQYTNGSYYCNECAEKYTKCPICGQYILKSEVVQLKDIKTPLTADEKMRYSKGACHTCINQLTDAYKRAGYYHDAPSDAPLFYNASRKNTPLASESDSGTRYFGIEFEFAIQSDDLYSAHCDDDDYDSTDDCLCNAVEQVLTELSERGYDRHVYSESDSSIEPYGYEFITNPMTLDYLMDTDIIKRIVNTTATAYFYDDESCGMHIHVNRGSLNKYSVAKMNMILTSLEYRQNYIVTKVSGRENGCDDWSKIVNFSDAYYCNNTEERYSCIYEQMRGNGRYVALNSQNKNTVEFRFFGSTMDISLIKYRLYFINALCSYANNHTLEQCMIVSVADLVEWDSRCKALFDRYL